MTITYPLLVNALIAGLLMGGFYAALSVGATVAFGLLDIVNIAHPTFAVIGAYAVLVLNRTFNIDPILCGLLLTPVCYGAGMLLYQVYHHFFERRGDDAMRGLAFFFGLMFIAEVALIMLFGVDFRYVHAPYITTTWNFGDVALPLRLAVPFAGSILMLVALELFLRKTFIGRAIVAVAQDPFALRLVAVSPVRIKRIAFGIACASAALAGAFIIIIQPLRPAVGREFIGRFSRSAFSAASAACRAPSLPRSRWAWSKISPPFSSARRGRRPSHSAFCWRRWRGGPPACSGGADAP
jgi:branched-chain amino acid transport system permease protein